MLTQGAGVGEQVCPLACRVKTGPTKRVPVNISVSGGVAGYSGSNRIDHFGRELLGEQ